MVGDTVYRVRLTCFELRFPYENDINFQKISIRMMKIIINMSVWNLYVIFNIKIFLFISVIYLCLCIFSISLSFRVGGNDCLFTRPVRLSVFTVLGMIPGTTHIQHYTKFGEYTVSN